jgi:hypothetical protein
MRKNSNDRARYDTERKQEGNTRVIPPTGRGYEETMRTYHEYAEAGRERDRERESVLEIQKDIKSKDIRRL